MSIELPTPRPSRPLSSTGGPGWRVEPWIDAVRIAERVRGLAAEVVAALPPPLPGASEELVVVGLLKGALVLTADLIRALAAHGVAVRLEFMKLSSYGLGTESSGKVRVDLDLVGSLAGRRVLLVDDILDTGRTLATAVPLLEGRDARSLQTLVLLDKPSRRQVPFVADHVGFEIPDRFVAGYGIDYAEHHRELPWIGVVRFDAEAAEA